MDRLARRTAWSARRTAWSARRDGPGSGRAGLALGSMLLALAGWVDAVGLVRWNGLYASSMSGNTTQFGGSPAAGDWHGTWDAGRALLMFVVGVVSGEVIGPAAKGWRGPIVVTAEAALLWLAAASVIEGWRSSPVWRR